MTTPMILICVELLQFSKSVTFDALVLFKTFIATPIFLCWQITPPMTRWGTRGSGLPSRRPSACYAKEASQHHKGNALTPQFRRNSRQDLF